MSDQVQPISREIPADLVAQLQSITHNSSFAPEATLETAYEQFHTLAESILNGNEPAITTTPTTTGTPATLPPRRNGKIPDPPMFDGNREKIEGFIAQLRLKLFSDPTLFSTPTLRMAYAFNRLEGRAQAQILPYIAAGATFRLTDVEDIIRILNNAFGDPDPIATARSKLHNLKQGKKEFTTYFAEFQTLVSKLDWNERAKIDALKEGLSIEIRRQLLGKTRSLSFDALVALCQELDSEMRALQMSEGKQGYQPPRPTNQPRNPPAAIQTQPTVTLPEPMDLSGTRRVSAQERAARQREGRCFYCGETGHRLAECPNKPIHVAATQAAHNHEHQPVVGNQTGNA
jgi:hypothetical protein